MTAPADAPRARNHSGHVSYAVCLPPRGPLDRLHRRAHIRREIVYVALQEAGLSESGFVWFQFERRGGFPEVIRDTRRDARAPR